MHVAVSRLARIVIHPDPTEVRRKRRKLSEWQNADRLTNGANCVIVSGNQGTCRPGWQWQVGVGVGVV